MSRPRADRKLDAGSGRIDGRAFRDSDQNYVARQSDRHDAALAEEGIEFGPDRREREDAA